MTSRSRRHVSLTGFVALLLTFLGWAITPSVAGGAWLWPFCFFISLPLGCLALLQIHALTGGRWGDLVGRDCVAAARTLVWVPLAFLPIALMADDLYPWARPHEVSSYQSEWLTLGNFQIRAFFYLTAWASSAVAISHGWKHRCGVKRSPEQTSSQQVPTPSQYRFWPRPHATAALLILFFLTTTFAAIDWMMSLAPHFHSSIFGAHFSVACLLSGVAFVSLRQAGWLNADQPGDGFSPGILVDRDSTTASVQPEDSNDRGNLLLAAVMVWMYFVFSQFFIAWSGNLPDEANWYFVRSEFPWNAVAVVMVVLGFALPLATLLSRDVKQQPQRLAIVAAAALVARLLETLWLVVPSLPHSPFSLHWLDISSCVALGCLWLRAFEYERSRTPPLCMPQAAELKSPTGRSSEASSQA